MLLTKTVRSYVFVRQLKICNVATPVLQRKLSSVDDDRWMIDENAHRDGKKYDIIIAGGGMVGCTLACALGKKPIFSHLKILLLEGSPNVEYNINKEEYSNRVVALNPNTKSLMESIDVWDHIANTRVQPVQHMQVWDASSDGLITFSNTDIDDTIAYIVENDLLLNSLKTELKKINNVEIVYQSKIESYSLPQDKSKLESIVKMANGNTYLCDLLIGADGIKSAVRKAMGVNYISWDYDQMGVVATLELADETTNTTAWQRFLPTGPVALLPLNSRSSSLVWSTSTEEAKRLLALSDESFVDALNDALWKQFPRPAGSEAATSFVGGWLQRLGLPDGASRQLPPSVRAVAPRSRAAFPLGFGHSSRYVAPGVALIGDAAHRVHPLAGQGVNLGFGDVTDLRKMLSSTVYCGLDINHESWLKQYETSRQRHNVPTQLAVEALHRVYSVSAAPLVLARGLALQLTNAALPLKKLIMNHASS